MQNSNKKNLIIVVLAILLIGLGYVFWPTLNRFFVKGGSAPIYSLDANTAKEKLVPADFPFPDSVQNSSEFQRKINNLLEYTDVWESSLTLEENKYIFEKYMRDKGWSPFLIRLDENNLTITGENDTTTLNINIQNISSSTLKTKVQVHFSQK